MGKGHEIIKKVNNQNIELTDDNLRNAINITINYNHLEIVKLIGTFLDDTFSRKTFLDKCFCFIS